MVFRLKSTAALAAVVATMMAAPAQALEQGDWLMRVGIASVMPDEESGEVTGIADSGVSVDDATSVGFTFAYMATPNVGIELLGALPFQHDITGTGSIDGVAVGSTKHLPPTLVGQYYFQPNASVRPYIGAGLNYTTFFDEDADDELEAALGGPTKINLEDSAGLAVMAGVDMDAGDDWFFNASAWYMQIDTEAELDTNGTIRTVDVDINPWAVMIGVGTSF